MIVQSYFGTIRLRCFNVVGNSVDVACVDVIRLHSIITSTQATSTTCVQQYVISKETENQQGNKTELK